MRKKWLFVWMKSEMVREVRWWYTLAGTAVTATISKWYLFINFVYNLAMSV